MGTRHKQTVINKKGEVKINQYGQWDGYPSGQGKDILSYLRNGNLKKYQKELEKINRITKEQDKMVQDDKNWKQNYPYLSRDCGSYIHQMIEDGSVKFVAHIDDEEAKKWCEGFYTIDFKNNTFTTEYYDTKVTFELNNLPTEEEYLEFFN